MSDNTLVKSYLKKKNAINLSHNEIGNTQLFVK